MKVQTPRGPLEASDSDIASAKKLLDLAFQLNGGRSGLSYELLEFLSYMAVQDYTDDKDWGKKAYVVLWYLRHNEVRIYQTPDDKSRFASIPTREEIYEPFDDAYYEICNDIIEGLRNNENLVYSTTRKNHGSSTRFDRALNDMSAAQVAYASGRGKHKRIYRGDKFPMQDDS